MRFAYDEKSSPENLHNHSMYKTSPRERGTSVGDGEYINDAVINISTY